MYVCKNLLRILQIYKIKTNHSGKSKRIKSLTATLNAAVNNPLLRQLFNAPSAYGTL